MTGLVPHLEGEDMITTLIKPRVGAFSTLQISGPASVAVGDVAQYAISTKNEGGGVLENIELTYTIPFVDINGTKKYMHVDNISSNNGEIDWDQLDNGKIIVRYPELGIGEEILVDIDISATPGIQLDSTYAMSAIVS